MYLNWHFQFTFRKIELAVFKGEEQRSWGESSESSAVYVSLVWWSVTPESVSTYSVEVILPWKMTQSST